MMNRILEALALIGSLSLCSFTQADYEPLNVVLITADDLNYNSVGAYGCTVPDITPNIDRLATQGMLFTQAYVNISICQPSRQSIMTGRYPHRTGALGFEPIDYKIATLQEELKKVGYLNAIIGKEEHLKPMDKFCWDYCIREEDVASGLGIGREPNLYYQYTAKFLAKAKKENKPFFLMANTHDPHRPFAGSDEEKKYWAEDLPKFSRQILPEEVTVPGFLPDLPEARREMAEYYTSVYRCDQIVGTIIKALDDSGFAGNTLVMFLSDNGISAPFSKGNCYLNSNKIPWIMRWPGQIPAGSIDSTHFISGIDFMPTVLHALHLSKVPDMDGFSFLPVLKGQKQKQRDAVFTQVHKLFSGREYPMRSVIHKNYTYIVNFWSNGDFQFTADALSGRTFKAMSQAANTNPEIAKRVDLLRFRVKEELYHVRDDPDALVNLIDDPDLVDEKRHLKDLLYAEMKRTKDPLLDEFKEKFLHDTASQKIKPNIVFILADQWRAQATGYSGDPNLIGKTPNLDRMAGSSVNFKNAISVTPVCTPYRAALMTGQYPTTTGMIFNDIHLPEQAVTMSELFKAGGYHTGYIGKWHLDGMGRFAYTPPDRRQGFDYWKALECSHEYNNLLYYSGESNEKRYWQEYGPYAETKDAVSFIQNNAGRDNPFLLVLAWGAPHFPHATAPAEFQKQFDAQNIILRDNVATEKREAAQKESVGYYAHILALDKCIGELQKAMDEAGISKNTIVVFTSDHGEMMGSHGVNPKQKQVPWAESVGVPFLLKYPARYGDTSIVVDAPINVPDILPTLLSLAGLPVPEAIEGENMARIIDNPQAGEEKAALVMNVSPFAGKAEEYRGIYTSRYAYVKTLKGPWFLFDHKEDPLQMNNLVDKPGYEQLQQELETALYKELKKIGDEFKPRQYYIDKWGFKLTEAGYIDYSDGAEFQGPKWKK